jgi:hypothetical protein
MTVEIQPTGGVGEEGDIEFWLGVGDAAPVQQQLDGGVGYEGRYYWPFNYSLQLHTNYYFQISVNLDPSEWTDVSEYGIGNCLETGGGCADALVTGFPCGCYFYIWREDNTVLDLSSGGNWADDVVLWKGGGPGPGPPTPTPTPGTAPNVNMCVNVREYQPGQE